MGLTLLSPPAVEPISPAAARLHCRIDDSLEDEYLAGVIAAARRRVEERTGRALLAQSWRLTLDRWPCRRASTGGSDPMIYLPKSPLRSVLAVKYEDADAAEQTLVSGTDYVTDAASEPGRIAPAPGVSWPSHRAVPAAVRVEFSAGWTTPELVPADLIHALKLIVADFFAFRETKVTGTIITKVPDAAEAILADWTVRGAEW